MLPEHAVRFKTISAHRWDEDAQEMQQDLYNNLGDIRWSLYRLFEQPEFLRNVLSLFFDDVPLNRQELCRMGEEIRQSCDERRRDNFRDFLSHFVNKHKETHHDNSVSLHKIQEMVGSYDANDEAMAENLNRHLHNAITNTEPSQQSRQFSSLSDMIIEFQEGLQNNTVVSLIFLVFHTEIGGKHFVIAEPVFRIHIRENLYAFLDRSSHFSTWSDYLLHCYRLSGRFCYPKNGIYTIDASNRVQVAFYGTLFEGQEICETWWFLPEPINSSATTDCTVSKEDISKSRIAQLVADAYQSRTAWLPKVVSVLSMTTIGVHKASIFMAKSGRVCSRPARFAVSVLNGSAITAHAFNVANVVCSLPAKYEKGTLNVYDTIEVCESVSGFHSFVKELRKYAAIYKETLIVQRRKGVGRQGRCVYREIVRELYDTVRERVPGKVTPVTIIENIADLANLSNNCSS